MAEHADLAVGPGLPGHPLIDDVLAVLRTLAAEQVKFAGRAASAAHAGNHRHVAVFGLVVLVVRRARAAGERHAAPAEFLAQDVVHVACWRLAFVRAAFVAGHLQDRRARPGRRVDCNVAAPGHVHVGGNQGAVRHRDIGVGALDVAFLTAATKDHRAGELRRRLVILGAAFLRHRHAAGVVVRRHAVGGRIRTRTHHFHQRHAHDVGIAFADVGRGTGRHREGPLLAIDFVNRHRQGGVVRLGRHQEVNAVLGVCTLALAAVNLAVAVEVLVSLGDGAVVPLVAFTRPRTLHRIVASAVVEAGVIAVVGNRRAVGADGRALQLEQVHQRAEVALGRHLLPVVHGQRQVQQRIGHVEEGRAAAVGVGRNEAAVVG